MSGQMDPYITLKSSGENMNLQLNKK